MKNRVKSHISSRLARRNQAGFVLIAGLMVWFALCGAVLIALLAMTLNASKLAAANSEYARQTRAADSSMEAAVQQIRMDPAGLIGSGDGKCEPGIGLPGEEGLNYDDTLGTSVLVTADCETSKKLTLADDTVQNAADLHVVGDRYNSPAELADTVHYQSDCATSPDTTCFPWSEGLGGAASSRSAEIAALNPTLLHTSDPATDPKNATLALSGNVRVKGSAIGFLKPPKANSKAAISVAGSFSQQARGPLAGADPEDSCGLLSSASPLALGSTLLTVSDGDSLTPACGDPVETQDSGLPAPTIWNTRGASAQTPACAGGGAVTKLNPGYYAPASTTQLNDLMGGSCPNSVIWFAPGNYLFDVDDPTNSPIERHSLIVDDPTVRIIFGEPAGGNNNAAALAAKFPRACNTEAPGVSVVLSARTSLRHKQGRVAICDRSISNSRSAIPAALWQTGQSGAGFSGTADAAESNSSGCVSEAGEPGCWTSASLRDFRSSGYDAADANPVGSLELVMSGTVSPNAAPTTPLDPTGTGGRGMTVSFYPAGSSSPLCSVEVPADAGLVSGTSFKRSVDLLSPALGVSGSSPRCFEVRSRITHADLAGSRVDVHIPSVSLQVGDFSLRSGWTATAGSASNVNGWFGAQNALNADGQAATADPAGCSPAGCPATTRSIRLAGFDNLDDPLTPTGGALAKVGLVIVGRYVSGTSALPADAPKTKATLSLADGSTCTSEWQATPLSPAGVYLDFAEGTGNCGSVVTRAEQLIGATATVDLFTPEGAATGDIGVDQIRISAVPSSGYSGPSAPDLFTMAANGDSASSTSINIFGPVSIPRATLNVRWIGAAALDDKGQIVPLIDAQAVVGAIGSSVGPDGQAGVLCCTATKAAERIVNLKAWVILADGSRVLMGHARVVISGTRWSNSPVRIVDWKLGPDDPGEDSPTTTTTTTTTVPPSSSTTTTAPAPTTTAPSQPSPATWTMKKRNPDWDGRYCADVTVNNPTSGTIEWIVDIPLEGHIDDFWNGVYDRITPETTRVSGIAGQNLTLRGGAQTSFGFCVKP